MMRTASLAALAVVACTGCGDGRNYNASVYEQVASDSPAATAAPSASGASGASGASSAAAKPRSSSSAPATQASKAAVAAAGTPQEESVESSPAEVVVAEAAERAETEIAAAEQRDSLAAQDPANEAALLDEAVRELNLPTPAEVRIVAGDEPYKKLAQDGKFKQFRSMSARYVQISKELLPYGRKLADGTATDADRATHLRLERAADKAFRPLNRYMWDDRWTEADRAAMGWILYGWQTEQK